MLLRLPRKQMTEFSILATDSCRVSGHATRWLGSNSLENSKGFSAIPVQSPTAGQR
jgi:hypothetical protein